MLPDKKIHWFITEECNLTCSYCFRPEEYEKTSPDQKLELLAERLTQEKIKKVTIGGGEPTLVKDLYSIMEILKEGGCYIGLHTNGLSLNYEEISKMQGIVDDVCLPLDSLDPNIQRELRGEGFMKTHQNIFRLTEMLNKAGIKVGYHTVFTSANHEKIPEIYKKISKQKFMYWRVYELNRDLTRQRIIKKAKDANEKEQEILIKRWEQIEKLRIMGSPNKGYTDCLLAHFILMENEMQIHNDPRIQFVELRDPTKQDYIFIRNDGNISFYSWFSGTERRPIGNLLKESFSSIERKFQRLNEDELAFDGKTEDEWIEATCNSPIWVRLAQDCGAYSIEEVEEVEERYLPLLEKLVTIYSKKGEVRSALL